MKTRRDLATRTASVFVAASLALLLLPSWAPAQEASDARWLPWLGCWESVGATADDAMLCVRPLFDAPGVEMLTVVAGQITLRESVLADGVGRDANREGCSGSESAEFSADARRLFLRSAQVCEGDVPRTSTGILAMVSPEEWIDVRAVDVAGESNAWLFRYQRARAARAEAVGLGDILEGRSLAVTTSARAASRPIDVDDVIEATERVDAEAVQAWVAELGEPLELDAERLVRMADAGVQDDVIDVVVAVSYPERFAIGEDADAVARQPMGTRGTVGYNPYYGYDPFYRGYFGRSLFYSPWGYGGYGRYGGYGGYGGYGYYSVYRPPIVIVRGSDADATRGRVVRGRGYTRGGSTGSSGGAARAGRGSRPATSARPSGGSGGSTRSAPPPKTRTAKPRRGGGGR